MPRAPDEVATKARPRVEETANARAFLVTVVAGPSAGRSVTIDPSQPSRVLVGQSPVCGLFLEDPHISRRHAALSLGGSGVRITDLGSTNGTYVNGVAMVEAYLQGGEVVQLGSTVLRIEPIASAGGVALSPATSFGRMVGASPAMRFLYPMLERLAASNVPVIIEGETGTGKEVLAESLHERGPRRAGPFVVFDCTAVPANLLESALFGHERGAFTGATEARRGVFEEANGGTLLIDEIGDLDVQLQAKLLRALERSEVQRIGNSRWTKVDVRVLAATRRNLDRSIQEGRFRDDLFFRLAVARVELPPLRAREGDVAVLAQHFWRMLADRGEPFPPDFLGRIEDYGWPGNVRELHNAIVRRLALGAFADPRAGDGSATPSYPPPSTAPSSPSIRSTDDALERILALELPWPRARQAALDEFAARYVERVLARFGGNATRAAAASGIALRYFRTLRSRQGR